MKKIYLFLFLSFIVIGCANSQKSSDSFLKTADLEDSDYAVMITNFVDKNITIGACFYDENDNILQRYKIGTATPNRTEIFRFDSYMVYKLFEDKHRVYIKYEAFLNSSPIPIDNEIPKILLTDLENSYTVCHFSENQSYIRHYEIGDPDAQKSTSVVYDETNSYVEFKLYDDLSWIKGKWILTEGYGSEILVFEAGIPFARVDEYNKGICTYSETVAGWIGLNDYYASFYVNEEKNIMKTVHPYALDPSVLIISIYEKEE